MNDKFEYDDIRIGVHARDRADAIQQAANILIDKGFITQGYVEEMLDVLEEYGPYFVLAPGMAFAHAKPSPSVLASGLSMAVLNKPVRFGNDENDPVSLVCVIASTDAVGHLKQLKRVAGFLGEEENFSRLLAARSEEQKCAVVDALNGTSSSCDETIAAK